MYVEKDKQKLKEKIELYELNHSGLGHINCAYVVAINLRIDKKEDRVYADVIHHYPEDKRKERYNGCYYKLSDLIKKEKVQNLSEICNICGKSVKIGSGGFVNRVPDLNKVSVRKEMKRAFPNGDFICAECDERQD